MDSWAPPSLVAAIVGTLMRVLTALCVLLGAAPVLAEMADAPLQQQVKDFALGNAGAVGSARFEVEVGRLDPRLRLAPCEEVQPYLPAATRLWGRSRIGLRCLRGPARWNVFLPVTVKVFGPGLVATRALPIGATLTSADIAQAEVDLAEDASNALLKPDLVVGRVLARQVDAGGSLRQSHLQARQWFAAGETVQVVAQGSGFSVSGEGQALTAGTEGQPARVRTENGRVLSGLPVGERRLEVGL